MTPIEDHNPILPDPHGFDIDEADIDPQLQVRNAFTEALTQNGFPDTLVLSRERANDVFHERRLELIDYLCEHKPRSVRALADELSYDKGVVSRDLQTLASLDIVEYVEDGRTKAPRLKHAHIAVEPIV